MKAMLFLVIGIALLSGAVVSGVDTLGFLDEAERGAGVVVALNAGGSYPEIRFVAADGRVISYPQGGWIAGYRVGDRVGVRYRASKPAATARIEAFGAIWAWPLALTVLGAGFALSGLIDRTVKRG